MKIALLGIAAVFLVVLVSGCSTTQIACNPPYIVKGSGCCLDQNSNAICDSDESTVPVKVYGAYQVKMYIQDLVPQADFWQRLPPSPPRHYDVYQIFNYETNQSLYDGGWLYLYTHYLEEPVTCTVKVYYDSVFYRQIATVTLVKRYEVENMSGTVIQILFEKANTPLQVRYDIACQGDESGITFDDAYAIGLKPP
jgi:hypothetical protein